jgi:hypothetical protein
MKTASRFMPPVAQRAARPIGWIFLFGLALGYLYLLWRHPYEVGLATVGLAAFTALWNRRLRSQLKRLAAERPGETVCEFARSFDVRSTDTWIIRAVYEELQEYLKSSAPSFPIRADDSLKIDLKIDGDDLEEDIVPRIGERTGRSLSDPSLNPFYRDLDTVRDLVRFLNAQPPSRAA